MFDRFQKERGELVAQLLDGPGHAQTSLRRAAASAGALPDDLRALVEKIRSRAYEITDEDIAQLKSRYDDDQLFELIVCAAVGVSLEGLERGLAALEEAT